jgi:Protein of unknown function (DUF2505)
MPRSFDLEVESPSSVEQVRGAFSNEDYWLARLAPNDNGTATLDSLIIDPDGTVNVTTTMRLVGDRLPRLVSQFRRGDLEMVHNETWRRIDGGQMHGEIGAAVPGAPLSALGTALLTPAPNGSRLTFAATVEIKVPLIGGALESFIGRQLTDGLIDMQRFTTDWIAENG